MSSTIAPTGHPFRRRHPAPPRVRQELISKCERRRGIPEGDWPPGINHEPSPSVACRMRSLGLARPTCQRPDSPSTTKEARYAEKAHYSARRSWTSLEPGRLYIPALATVLVTSEAPEHPVDCLFDGRDGPGGTRWVASVDGDRR